MTLEGKMLRGFYMTQWSNFLTNRINDLISFILFMMFYTLDVIGMIFVSLFYFILSFHSVHSIIP